MGKNKKNRIQKEIDRIFYILTKNKAKELYIQEIKCLKKEGIELSKKERQKIRREIIEECSEDAKGKAKKYGIRSALFGAGILVGVVGTLALNPGVDGVSYDKNNKQTVVNMDQIDGTLNITGNTVDTAKAYREDMAKSAISEDARRKANDEIENAKTPQEVRKIVKDILIEELNQYSGKKVTDVSFYKTSTFHTLYEDADGNIRFDRASDSEDRGEGTKGVQNNIMIEITITTEDGENITKRITQQNGKIHSVYGTDEKTEDDIYGFECRDNGSLIYTGVDLSIAMNQDGNSWDVNSEYERRFQERLTEYYNGKVEEARKEYTLPPQVGKTTNEIEIE